MFELDSYHIETAIMCDEEYIPKYAHRFDASADCKAAETVRLAPGESALVDLGFSVNIPPQFVGLLFSRSGLSARERIEVANGVGVIDAGYTGNVKAHLVNNGEQAYQIIEGDRVAQIMLAPIHKFDFVHINSHESTDRGSNGFGSTGQG